MWNNQFPYPLGNAERIISGDSSNKAEELPAADGGSNKTGHKYKSYQYTVVMVLRFHIIKGLRLHCLFQGNLVVTFFCPFFLFRRGLVLRAGYHPLYPGYDRDQLRAEPYSCR